MIIRIVKMEFQPEKLPIFLAMFEKTKAKIRNVEGCQHLTLWQDQKDPTIVFTHSHWISESHLETYRHSELFRNIWKQTKMGFKAKPQAWSVQAISMTE